MYKYVQFIIFLIKYMNIDNVFQCDFFSMLIYSNFYFIYSFNCIKHNDKIFV